MVKTQNKLQIEARYLNKMNIILHGEKNKNYLSKSEITSAGSCDGTQAQPRGAEVRGGGLVELPHVQVRRSSCALLEQL